MAIASNTRIKLGASKPKKAAVVDTPGTPPADSSDEIAIWAASSVPTNIPQSIIGQFTNLFDYAKSNMKAIRAAGAANAPVVVHMPYNGNESEIEIGGTPTATEIRLEIGSLIYNGDRSHFLNRTWVRLRERWLEEDKNG